MAVLSRHVARWRYRLERHFTWQSALATTEDVVCLDEHGKVRLVIEAGGRLTVMRGYAWNGCSPTICVFDLLLGTPDGAVYLPTGRPKTYFASLVHDALYQFLDAGSPFTRAQADRCFLQLMTESEFLLRGAYWFAVRVFGGLVWRGKKTVRGWRGEVRSVSAPAAPAAGQDVARESA